MAQQADNGGVPCGAATLEEAHEVSILWGAHAIDVYKLVSKWKVTTCMCLTYVAFVGCVTKAFVGVVVGTAMM